MLVLRLLLILCTLLVTGVRPPLCFGQHSSRSTQIYNDSFVEAAHLELKPFVEKYKPTLLSRQKIANLHVPAQRDYVLTYQVGTGKFVFYQTSDKALIQSFTCSTPRVVLAKGVQVGMSQAAFERVFHQQLAGTMATVADTEAFQLYTFTFLKHLLARIDYQCRID
jgi:hypothetical protein